MGRLFWKIFLWFCAALTLVAIAVGWGVKLYMDLAADEFHRELPLAWASALSVTIEQSGPAQARELLTQLADESRRPLFVVDDRNRDILGRPLPPRLELRVAQGLAEPDRLIVREAIAPSGEHFRVLVPTLIDHRAHRHGFDRAPAWLSLLIALAVGLVVCFWLARYLSRPVARLSHASRALAAGHLDSRVGDLGGRRDEITDLARDFDRMAERMQQLLQSQKQLLGDISHELRSPLARLRVAVALAHRQGSEAAVALGHIERDVERMETLVSELLTLFRLESAGPPDLGQHIDLKELLKELVATNAIEAGVRRCELELAVDPIAVTGNAELLCRALENVVRNAILHTEANSRVTIAAGTKAESVEISICDRGPGVAATALPTLFDPFVRTDDAREHGAGGFGLGLAIARRAIELHGGSIRARNRTDGRGLCVEINLPGPRADGASRGHS